MESAHLRLLRYRKSIIKLLCTFRFDRSLCFGHLVKFFRVCVNYLLSDSKTIHNHAAGVMKVFSISFFVFLFFVIRICCKSAYPRLFQPLEGAKRMRKLYWNIQPLHLFSSTGTTTLLGIFYLNFVGWLRGLLVLNISLLGNTFWGSWKHSIALQEKIATSLSQRYVSVSMSVFIFWVFVSLYSH